MQTESKSDDIRLRPANASDLNFLVWIDIKDEGVSSPYMSNWDDEAWAEHRRRIAEFIELPERAAIVAEWGDGRRVGAIYARLRNRHAEPDDPASISLCLDRSIFPSDGRYCEIYQLWVDPALRRQGLASRLKLAIETEAQKRGVSLICTATEAENHGVIALNEKLGYRVARVGTLWDDVQRVCLVKNLVAST